MNVLIAYLTTEGDDPNMEQEFINGYELHGGTWTGDIDIEENVDFETVTTEWLQSKVDAGYDMIIRNTGMQNEEAILYAGFTSALDQGLLYVTAVGSNDANKNLSYFENYLPVVRCGSGQRGLGNATAYPCMFYDQALESEPVLDIEYIFQCGTSYTISEISRFTATTLLMKFEGVSDVRDIGFFDHGIPFYIDSLSGSDISPLPSGAYYTGGILADGVGIFFTVPATTGSAGYQSVTGSITYGNDTSDIAIVKVPTYQSLITYGGAVTIDGVSGFNNDIDGLYEIYAPVNFDGFGDKLKISAVTGGGSYEGGGTASFVSQSYATPYIGGQLAWIKDRMGSDWYDVIGRAMKTASRYTTPGYTYKNGFGYIKGDEAVLYSSLDLDTPVISEIPSNYYSLFFKWNPVPYAEEYEVYYKGALHTTLKAHITEFKTTGSTISAARESKSQRRLFKVRAKRGTDYSEFSNELEFNYYCNTGIVATEAPE